MMALQEQLEAEQQARAAAEALRAMERKGRTTAERVGCPPPPARGPCPRPPSYAPRSCATDQASACACSGCGSSEARARATDAARRARLPRATARQQRGATCLTPTRTRPWASCSQCSPSATAVHGARARLAFPPTHAFVHPADGVSRPWILARPVLATAPLDVAALRAAGKATSCRRHAPVCTCART